MSFKLDNLDLLDKELNLPNFYNFSSQELIFYMRYKLHYLKGTDRNLYYKLFPDEDCKEKDWELCTKCLNCDLYGFPCLNCCRNFNCFKGKFKGFPEMEIKREFWSKDSYRYIKGKDREEFLKKVLSLSLTKSEWEHICKCKVCDNYGFPCSSCRLYIANEFK